MSGVDLHLHTDHSDGTWTPADLIEHAAKLKLRHIAITDHDTVNGIVEARAAAGCRLEVIDGIEINTVDCSPGRNSEDVHILGYFIDTKSAKLLSLLERQSAARMRHAKACAERVTSVTGVPLTIEMVLKNVGRGGVGKMHLARAIIEAGCAKDAVEAYEKFLTRSAPHFVPRQSVTPEEAIRVIVESGGIASIAHPGKSAHIFDLILRLQQVGLGAIEAYHRIHSQDRVRQYVRFAARNQLLVTGGSDCHGPFEEYAPTMGTITVPQIVLDNLRARARGLEVV